MSPIAKSLMRRAADGLGNGVPRVVDDGDKSRPLFRERAAHAARERELTAAQLHERGRQGVVAPSCFFSRFA